MSSQLHQFLAHQEQSGVHDSEGSFSLRADRAWEKLGAFQLPFSEAWVLKLVQSAVGLGASQVKVTQSWEETKLRFVGCRLELADVEEAVFDSPQYLRAGLRHLGTAIRALATGTEQPFSLSFGQEIDQVWTGDRFTSRSWVGGRPCEDFTVTVAHFKRGDVSDIWSLPSAVLKEKVAAISQAFCQSCYVSPIKLSIDGRLVNGVHSDPIFGVKPSKRPLSLFRIPEIPELPPLTLLLGRDWRHSPTSDFRLHLDFPQPETGFGIKAGAWVLVSAFLQDPMGLALASKRQAAQLLWVTDGVVVEREALPYRGTLSFMVLANAHGLDTDLTGLSLRRNQAYLNRRESALNGVGDWIAQHRDVLLEAPIVLRNEEDPWRRVLATLEPLFKYVRPFLGESAWVSPELRERRRQETEQDLKSAFHSVCQYLETLAS